MGAAADAPRPKGAIVAFMNLNAVWPRRVAVFSFVFRCLRGGSVLRPNRNPAILGGHRVLYLRGGDMCRDVPSAR